LTRVPRYFFHVRESVDMIDRVGNEFSGSEEALREAVVAAGEMLRDVGGRFWNNREWRMWVTDEAGATVCALRFSAERLIPGDEE
jgi:hypothetical protein